MTCVCGDFFSLTSYKKVSAQRGMVPRAHNTTHITVQQSPEEEFWIRNYDFGVQ